MNLKQGFYEELAKNVKEKKQRIVIYGAGMIGQIVVPDLINRFSLCEYVDFFVDRDNRKIGKTIEIGDKKIEIKSPDIFSWTSDNWVILLTNSKFNPIVDYLETFDSLKNVDCYLIPIMQIYEQRISIPKTIHYCWFGRKDVPEFLQKCIDSWRIICPDYEIKRWDESNYDVSKYLFTKQAYEKKRYGFVSDVARLDILYQWGGVYLDTDVKLLKPFGELMYNKGFVGVERWGNINSGGGIGAIPNHPMIKEILDYRLKFPFVLEDGSTNEETNGLYETKTFIKHGMKIDNTMQIINNMIVYPSSFFHPYDYMSCEEKIKDNTISIHYFYGGWMKEEDRNNRTKTQEKFKELCKRIEEA